MELVAALGVNNTLVYQFAIFFVVFTALYVLAFKPYFNAFLVRTEKTVGNTELAERVQKETEDLETQYASKAREVNEKFKELFDRTRSEAMQEYEKVVSEARNTARGNLEKARQDISAQVTAAQTQLRKEIPEVASVIAAQILGKEGRP